MVSEAIKKRFEKVASRVSLVDKNWTIADLCELGSRELEGGIVGRIPPHIEAALKVLLGEVPKKKRVKSQAARHPRGKFLATEDP
jgi:hypothetical protein